VLDLWFGLRVMHLPGPTPGHCGFYCRHIGVLFCGALPSAERPPRWIERLTFDRESSAASLRAAAKLGASLVCSSRA
jgi:glyoxylase-like metal-dependent hydrolase (beta-lactamase superfamily II)